LILFAAIALLSSCSKEVAEQKAPSEPVLSRQYRQGSVTAIVSASETNIAATGQVQLTLDVQVPPGTDVVFPEVGNRVEPFTLSGSWTEPLQTLPNGKILHRGVWLLVPSLPGEVVFQPLEIAAGPATLKTEPILVSVRSILPEGLDTLEIKDIAAPATLLPEQRKEQQRWLIFLGLATATALVVLCIGLGRRPKRVVVLSPHEEAFQALETLPADAMVRLHELTRILLQYIARRFHVPVVGKTTKEIVPDVPRFPLLGHRQKLVKFLETSEQIRFSNRLPDGFTEKSECYIRWIIEETKEGKPCA